MKVFLAASQSLCLLALLISSPRRYRITLAFMLAVIPATLAFRSDSLWLHAWYPVLVGPVALLRLAAGLEIAHRQTEGFRYWCRLMGSVFLIGGMFSALAWVQSGNPDTLRSVVEFRRLLQIFAGAVFLVLESFWISQGGGFYRRADQLAGVWGVMALSHGAVSFLAGLGQYRGLTVWLDASGVAWLIDALCYLGLTGLFLSGRRCVPGTPSCFDSLRAWFRSPASSPE